MSDLRILSLPHREVDDDLSRRCATLNWTIWPCRQALEERVAKWSALRTLPDSDQCSDAHLHTIIADDRAVAMARSFRRVVASGGRRFTVLALESVCTDPQVRGGGHGTTVVRAAFARVGTAADACFFQTGVPAFYTRLGARTVANRIVNSLGPKAFWDSHAMIWPATAAWPDGEIDILGPGW